jgi:hypothetical protein
MRISIITEKRNSTSSIKKTEWNINFLLKSHLPPSTLNCHKLFHFPEAYFKFLHVAEIYFLRKGWNIFAIKFPFGGNCYIVWSWKWGEIWWVLGLFCLMVTFRFCKGYFDMLGFIFLCRGGNSEISLKNPWNTRRLHLLKNHKIPTTST